MASDIIREIEKSYMKEDLPQLFPGDSVKVQVRIKEGNKERIQAYEGIVIKLSGNGVSKTVTVRRVFQGVGIERVFMVHSPAVEKITVLRRGDVRRAKLYYLRNLAGKAARIREKTNGYAGKLNMAAQAEAASNKKKANKKAAAEKAD